MTCTTHYHACDCREERMQSICKRYLEEHIKLRQAMFGMRKSDKCNCPECRMIRELYPDLEK